jgi:hypothetical protein
VIIEAQVLRMTVSYAGIVVVMRHLPGDFVGGDEGVRRICSPLAAKDPC